MNRRINLITIIIFCGMLAIVPIWLIVAPVRDYSPNENRYLSRMPEFSSSALLHGEFTTRFEDYISDQFPMRDKWVLMNSKFRRLSGRMDNNGVYYGNRLIETFWTYDANILDKNLGAIDAYSEKITAEDNNSHSYFLPIPNRIWAAANDTESKLPSHAPDIRQDILIQSMSSQLKYTEIINISDMIAEKAASIGTDSLYYGTDHHMTTHGAYEIYNEIGEILGYSPLTEDEFTVTEVSKDFEGTVFHKSGAWWTNPDTIERWDSDYTSKVTVTIGDKLYNSMYDDKALETVEKYNYFLYGNNPLVVIRNPEASGKILIVKDSYAHAILPFLANHYEEIHVIDLRYYRGSVSHYRVENELTETLVIYNVKNLTEDTSLNLLD